MAIGIKTITVLGGKDYDTGTPWLLWSSIQT